MTVTMEMDEYKDIMDFIERLNACVGEGEEENGVNVHIVSLCELGKVLESKIIKKAKFCEFGITYINPAVAFDDTGASMLRKEEVY